MPGWLGLPGLSLPRTRGIEKAHCRRRSTVITENTRRTNPDASGIHLRLPHGRALSTPIAVVAHDAGAANLLAEWTPYLGAPLRTCLSGPAATAFRRRRPEIALLPLPDALDGAALVLTGTGWGSHLEHEARRLARLRGIESIAVLDHWVNYRQRFSRGGLEVLPDLLIVTDADAERVARESVPEVPITRWPNLYLERQLATICESDARRAAHVPQRLLVVTEPLHNRWSGDGRLAGELLAINYLFDNLAALSVDPRTVEIRIRAHPSEPPDKYQAACVARPSLHIDFSDRGELADDIAWADTVAGCESYALVVALAAGRRTICILPPAAPQCRLPHQDLLHLKRIVSVAP